MPAPENKASLGCGTLILIALIVMFFGNSNRDVDKKLKQQVTALQSEVSDLRSDVRNLQTTISNQSSSLADIKKSLEEITKRASQARLRVVPPTRPSSGEPTPEAPLPEN